MVVFFDLQGVDMVEEVPTGKNFNMEYYMKIQQTLRERIGYEELTVASRQCVKSSSSFSSGVFRKQLR